MDCRRGRFSTGPSILRCGRAEDARGQREPLIGKLEANPGGRGAEPDERAVVLQIAVTSRLQLASLLLEAKADTNDLDEACRLARHVYEPAQSCGQGDLFDQAAHLFARACS